MNELREQRFRMLNALYQWSGGDTRTWVALDELCEKNGVSFETKAYHYLADEGLIAYYGARYTCYITHSGIKAIEKAWGDPNRATEYFPATADMEPKNGKR